MGKRGLALLVLLLLVFLAVPAAALEDCTTEKPCSVAELRDCDNDNECQNGLECQDDWSPWSDDFCCPSGYKWIDKGDLIGTADPSGYSGKNDYGWCVPEGQGYLALGQGDCDSDSDCASGYCAEGGWDDYCCPTGYDWVEPDKLAGLDVRDDTKSDKGACARVTAQTCTDKYAAPSGYTTPTGATPACLKEDDCDKGSKVDGLCPSATGKVCCIRKGQTNGAECDSNSDCSGGRVCKEAAVRSGSNKKGCCPAGQIYVYDGKDFKCRDKLTKGEYWCGKDSDCGVGPTGEALKCKTPLLRNTGGCCDKYDDWDDDNKACVPDYWCPENQGTCQNSCGLVEEKITGPWYRKDCPSPQVCCIDKGKATLTIITQPPTENVQIEIGTTGRVKWVDKTNFDCTKTGDIITCTIPVSNKGRTPVAVSATWPDNTFKPRTVSLSAGSTTEVTLSTTSSGQSKTNLGHGAKGCAKDEDCATSDPAGKLFCDSAGGITACCTKDKEELTRTGICKSTNECEGSTPLGRYHCLDSCDSANQVDKSNLGCPNNKKCCFDKAENAIKNVVTTPAAPTVGNTFGVKAIVSGAYTNCKFTYVGQSQEGPCATGVTFTATSGQTEVKVELLKADKTLVSTKSLSITLVAPSATGPAVASLSGVLVNPVGAQINVKAQGANLQNKPCKFSYLEGGVEKGLTNQPCDQEWVYTPAVSGTVKIELADNPAVKAQQDWTLGSTTPAGTVDKCAAKGDGYACRERKDCETRALIYTGLCAGTAVCCKAAGSVTPPTSAAPCGTDYTVKWGESLNLIANRCGVTLQTLLSCNPSVTAYPQWGQTIKVNFTQGKQDECLNGWDQTRCKEYYGSDGYDCRCVGNDPLCSQSPYKEIMAAGDCDVATAKPLSLNACPNGNVIRCCKAGTAGGTAGVTSAAVIGSGASAKVKVDFVRPTANFALVFDMKTDKTSRVISYSDLTGSSYEWDLLAETGKKTTSPQTVEIYLRNNADNTIIGNKYSFNFDLSKPSTGGAISGGVTEVKLVGGKVLVNLQRPTVSFWLNFDLKDAAGQIDGQSSFVLGDGAISGNSYLWDLLDGNEYLPVIPQTIEVYLTSFSSGELIGSKKQLLLPGSLLTNCRNLGSGYDCRDDISCDSNTIVRGKCPGAASIVCCKTPGAAPSGGAPSAAGVTDIKYSGGNLLISYVTQSFYDLLHIEFEAGKGEHFIAIAENNSYEWDFIDTDNKFVQIPQVVTFYLSDRADQAGALIGTKKQYFLDPSLLTSCRNQGAGYDCYDETSCASGTAVRGKCPGAASIVCCKTSGAAQPSTQASGEGVTGVTTTSTGNAIVYFKKPADAFSLLVEVTVGGYASYFEEKNPSSPYIWKLFDLNDKFVDIPQEVTLYLWNTTSNKMIGAEKKATLAATIVDRCRNQEGRAGQGYDCRDSSACVAGTAVTGKCPGSTSVVCCKAAGSVTPTAPASPTTLTITAAPSTFVLGVDSLGFTIAGVDSGTVRIYDSSNALVYAGVCERDKPCPKWDGKSRITNTLVSPGQYTVKATRGSTAESNPIVVTAAASSGKLTLSADKQTIDATKQQGVTFTVLNWVKADHQNSAPFVKLVKTDDISKWTTAGSCADAGGNKYSCGPWYGHVSGTILPGTYKALVIESVTSVKEFPETTMQITVAGASGTSSTPTLSADKTSFDPSKGEKLTFTVSNWVEADHGNDPPRLIAEGKSTKPLTLISICTSSGSNTYTCSWGGSTTGGTPFQAGDYSIKVIELVGDKIIPEVELRVTIQGATTSSTPTMGDIEFTLQKEPMVCEANFGIATTITNYKGTTFGVCKFTIDGKVIQNDLFDNECSVLLNLPSETYGIGCVTKGMEATKTVTVALAGTSLSKTKSFKVAWPVLDLPSNFVVGDEMEVKVSPSLGRGGDDANVVIRYYSGPTSASTFDELVVGEKYPFDAADAGSHLIELVSDPLDYLLDSKTITVTAATGSITASPSTFASGSSTTFMVSGSFSEIKIYDSNDDVIDQITKSACSGNSCPWSGTYAFGAPEVRGKPVAAGTYKVKVSSGSSVVAQTTITVTAAGTSPTIAITGVIYDREGMEADGTVGFVLFGDDEFISKTAKFTITNPDKTTQVVTAESSANGVNVKIAPKGPGTYSATVVVCKKDAPTVCTSSLPAGSFVKEADVAADLQSVSSTAAIFSLTGTDANKPKNVVVSIVKSDVSGVLRKEFKSSSSNILTVSLTGWASGSYNWYMKICGVDGTGCITTGTAALVKP